MCATILFELSLCGGVSRLQIFPQTENPSIAETFLDSQANPPHHRKQLQVDLASQSRDSGAHEEMLKPPEQWKG